MNKVCRLFGSIFYLNFNIDIGAIVVKHGGRGLHEQLFCCPWTFIEIHSSIINRIWYCNFRAEIEIQFWIWLDKANLKKCNRVNSINWFSFGFVDVDFIGTDKVDTFSSKQIHFSRIFTAFRLAHFSWNIIIPKNVSVQTPCTIFLNNVLHNVYRKSRATSNKRMNEIKKKTERI